MTAQLTTLTCGESTISSPDKALVLQFANFVLGGDLERATGASIGTCATADTAAVPALGQYWEGQGGVYAGIVRGEGELPDYHLIVATEDLGKLEWGSYGTEVSGAGSASDGAANTRALCDGDRDDHPAADACVQYQADGHADFYLPARRELQIAEANTSDLFAKEWYWSSTQRSALSAFSMHFVDGTQYDFVEDIELRVRPVRRLIL